MAVCVLRGDALVADQLRRLDASPGQGSVSVRIGSASLRSVPSSLSYSGGFAECPRAGEPLTGLSDETGLYLWSGPDASWRWFDTWALELLQSCDAGRVAAERACRPV